MLTNLESWFADHTAEVEQALQKHADKLFGYGELCERNLSLSDLQLCGAVGNGTVPIPESFARQSVAVRINDRLWIEPHYIAVHGHEVVDVVAGQFFADEVRDISGLAIMLNRAPQLFHVLSEELTVLHATMEDIKDNFGIEYIFE